MTAAVDEYGDQPATDAGEASRTSEEGEVLSALAEAFAAPQKGVARAFGIVFSAMQVRGEGGGGRQPASHLVICERCSTQWPCC